MMKIIDLSHTFVSRRYMNSIANTKYSRTSLSYCIT